MTREAGSSTPSYDGAPMVPVRARGRIEPAAVVIMAAVAIMAAGLWKPWDAGAGPVPTSALGASAAAGIGAAGRPFPAVSGLLTEAPSLRPAPAPSLDGLDLSFMGVTDLHRAWGVAAAYVPRGVIRDAARRGQADVTPVVDWVSGALSASSPDLPLNHPDSVAVALAVTWPSGLAPRSVELVALGATGSVDGAMGPRRSAKPVTLRAPLPQLTRLVPPALTVGESPDQVEWRLLSGTFFLPSSQPPADPTGWLSTGWTPGPYAFVVTRLDGSTTTLQFRIGA